MEFQPVLSFDVSEFQHQASSGCFREYGARLRFLSATCGVCSSHQHPKHCAVHDLKKCAQSCIGQSVPSPGDLSDPGIELVAPALQVDYLPAELPGKPIHILPPKPRCSCCFFSDSFPVQVISMEESSLCYTVGPFQLSVLSQHCVGVNPHFPLYPFSRPFPLGNHKFVFYVCGPSSVS